MDNQNKNSSFLKTETDNLVWAQMRYCSYWPARVVQTPPEMGNTPRGQLCVLFFGTKEFGFVDEDKIKNYQGNREKFISKGRGADFKKAVKDMDEYLSNPKMFRSHAVVKFNGKKLAIKTERDVQIRLNVKKEPNASKKLQRIKTNSIANGWEQEKRKLVEQVVSLKTENHRNHLSLKKMESEHAKNMIERKKLEETLNGNTAAFSKQMNELRRKLENVQHEIGHNKLSSDKIISELRRENQLLLARNKQLQTGMEHRKSANITTTPSDSAEQSLSKDVYEVEKIIAHKNTKAGTKYLIRWKGYESDDDTWERESNLNCPGILNKYHSTNKKK